MTSRAPSAFAAGLHGRRGVSMRPVDPCWPQTTLERAFQMAQSGRFVSLTDIRAALVNEGYSNVKAQISGASLIAQLGRLLTQAHAVLDQTPA
jgi:hypothetical protein